MMNKSAWVALCLLAAACGEEKAGTLGVEGRVRFVAEDDLVFTETLVNGSAVRVSLTAQDDEDKKRVKGATLASSDKDILTVDEPFDDDGDKVFLFHTKKTGSAELEVKDGDKVIDHIAIKTAKAGAVQLVDATLLKASEDVDARLPSAFAVLRSTCDAGDDGDGCATTRLALSAVDTCGGGLLDAHASKLVSDDDVTIATAGLAQFDVQVRATDPVKLRVQTPGQDDLSYSVTGVEGADVDEVEVAALVVNDDNSITLWGRAFADDVELTGDLSYSWTADERVTLTETKGLITTATASVPAQGEPADERPATVTAEVFGAKGTIDLLTAKLFEGRKAPSQTATPTPDESCLGSTCVPALLFLFPLRVTARRRRRLG